MVCCCFGPCFVAVTAGVVAAVVGIAAVVVAANSGKNCND